MKKMNTVHIHIVLSTKALWIDHTWCTNNKICFSRYIHLKLTKDLHFHIYCISVIHLIIFSLCLKMASHKSNLLMKQSFQTKRINSERLLIQIVFDLKIQHPKINFFFILIVDLINENFDIEIFVLIFFDPMVGLTQFCDLQAKKNRFHRSCHLNLVFLSIFWSLFTK